MLKTHHYKIYNLKHWEWKNDMTSHSQVWKAQDMSHHSLEVKKNSRGLAQERRAFLLIIKHQLPVLINPLKIHLKFKIAI